MYKIVANWKMYLDVQKSRHLAAQLNSWVSQIPPSELQFTLCPSDMALWDVARQIESSMIKLGAQNISRSEAHGAFTGQTPAQQLREAGVIEVLLGHSEVRQFLGDTDEVVAQKLQVALHHELTPIICVGETKADRDSGVADGVVAQQLATIFEHISLQEGITIAYEPRWAISSVSQGATCSPEDAAHMHQVIEHALHEHGDTEVVERIPILYGGSVSEKNILSYLDQPRIDGVLIGGASAKEEDFHSIVKLLTEHIS